MKKIFLISLLTFLLYGCAGKLMQKTTVSSDMKLNNGQSALIFIRTSGSFSAPIAEYKNEKVDFIGNSTGGSIIMHVTNAGKHEYIIAAGRGSILKVDLKPGMFYYVYLFTGSKDGRSILFCEPYEPNKTKKVTLFDDYVKNVNENSVKSDSNAIMWQKNTPEGYAWFNNNMPSFISKYNYALKTGSIYNISADMGVSTLIK